MPEISIIVPIYNTENRISKCIESILNQSFKDFELLLINDGSTDGSYDICKKYEQMDKRIRLFDRKNSGVSASRNIGIRQAQGNYVMFCDSDDTVERDWCQKLFESIVGHPDAFINCGMSIVNAERTVSSLKITDNNLKQIMGKEDYYLLHKIGISGSPCNKIFSVNILNANNITFDENISFAEDVKFCCDYFSFCEEIVMINTSLYNYYRDGENNSLTTKYHNKLYDMQKLTYEFRKMYIAEKYRQSFLREYFYKFSQCLENTFDKRNRSSLIKK